MTTTAVATTMTTMTINTATTVTTAAVEFTFSSALDNNMVRPKNRVFF
jgi:hypothetical protein